MDHIPQNSQVGFWDRHLILGRILKLDFFKSYPILACLVTIVLEFVIVCSLLAGVGWGLLQWYNVVIPSFKDEERIKAITALILMLIIFIVAAVYVTYKIAYPLGKRRGRQDEERKFMAERQVTQGISQSLEKLKSNLSRKTDD